MKSLSAAIVFLIAFTASSRGEVSGEGIAFFESRIRPALVKYCYECHSEAEGKSKGGLLVDSKRALEQGGDNGPAVVSGDVAASFLYTAVQYEDPDFEMPPKGKLPDAVIADFKTWIEMGAPDPRVDNAPVKVEKSGIDIEAGRKFWSFSIPEKPKIPAVENVDWPRSEVDHFILSKLEKAQLSPASDARPEVLVRRLYFVLTGLPPSMRELIDWTRKIGSDLDEEAVGALVDSLLASPRFGERWGQHWLDVARYADSTGGDSNNIFPEAWRYRDYVIASFNADKPFDQFIREQLAGDLLPRISDEDWARKLVATGFLAVGQKLVGEEDDRKFRMDLIDEQLDATSRAFLGVTVACARCHDHKTDPIPQTDYYAMAGFFQNTRTFYGLLDAQARQSSSLVDVTALGLPSGREVLSPQELQALMEAKEEADAAMDDIRGNLRGSEEKVSRAKLRRSRTQRDRTAAALEGYDEEGRPRTKVMGARDSFETVETRLLIRGDVEHPGPVVAPGFLQVASSSQPSSIEGSGRLELANWIASKKNPLTARVAANRIWYWLFGQGIVSSADDFGATGNVPSHPELLDFLAIRLVESEWSFKKMIRELVFSRTWQQASDFHEENFEKDPDTRLFWRVSQRRLEAEAIRDAMLTVSGNLEFGRPLPPLLDAVGEGTVGQNVYEPEIRAIQSNARSVYLPRVRNVLPESLALFDAPDSSNVTGVRDTMTVPLQSLYSLNDPFVHNQAVAFASRLSRLPAHEQINYAHLIAFGRYPTAREVQLGQLFAQSFRREESSDASDSMIAYCHALLCAAEFAMID